MNLQVWQFAFGVFTGTLPLLGVIIYNLIEVKGIRAELLQIRMELSQIRTDLASVRERVAILEERDRWTHPLVTK
jgi:hypothetical protein